VKRRIAGTLFAIGVVVLGLGLSFYLNPIKFPRDHIFELGPLSGVSQSSHRDNGERVEGYFTVAGGNEEVEFTAKDPYGACIYNSEAVTSRGEFAFTAEHDGVYTLFFRNKQDSGKMLFLTEQKPVMGGVLGLGLAGIGVLILVLGLFWLFEERLKQVGKKVEQPSPPPSNP
jgi:hypothetical protein